jgi:transposase
MGCDRTASAEEPVRSAAGGRPQGAERHRARDPDRLPLAAVSPGVRAVNTIYNRFNRWSGKGHWKQIFEALIAGNWIPETVSMDASYVKARRSAHGGNV